MRKTKSIVFHQGYEQCKMTIGKLFITIRKTMAVPKSEFDARWLRERFYNVRKKGDLIFFKSQAIFMLNVAEAMKSYLVEKDGIFYLSKDGELSEWKNIRMTFPDKENPRFESVIRIANRLCVTIANGIRDISVRNRKQKKLFKRVFFNAVMENKRKIRLQQFMTINAELMRTMLDMLEGNIKTGFYFDLSKGKIKDRYEN